MNKTTKLAECIKALALATALLAATEIVAANTPVFDNTCTSSGCHGPGNTANSGDPVLGILPQTTVSDTSAAGIKNAAATITEMALIQIQLQLGAITDQTIADISAELTQPAGCTPPQTLVNGVCSTPTPSCTPPQTLVNGACITPTLTACDDIANKALCINQLHQYGSLGNTATLAAKTDIYKVNCAKQAVAVSASVMSLTADNPAKLSIEIGKGADASRASIDKVNGDGVASKSAKLAKGPGAYLVKINKGKSKQAGSVQYDAQISCLDKKRAQIGANIVIKKNQ